MLNRPQRSFVVEYKSNRRQPKHGVKSIWGDTDLKALAQAVAADTPEPKEISSSTGHARAECPNDAITRELEHRSPVPVATKEIDAPETTRQANRVPGETNETQSVSDQAFAGKRKTGPRTIVKIAKQPTKPALQVSTRLPPSLATFSSDDILSILEMENRRLKGLLVEKLRAENTQLKKMMQRFEVRTP